MAIIPCFKAADLIRKKVPYLGEEVCPSAILAKVQSKIPDYIAPSSNLHRCSQMRSHFSKFRARRRSNLAEFGYNRNSTKIKRLGPIRSFTQVSRNGQSR